MGTISTGDARTSCEIPSGPDIVLLVEDEDDMRRVLEVWMQTHYWCRVVCLQDATDILRVVRETSPVLVLMDLILPGFSGYQAISLLKSEPSTTCIPVVAISAMGWDLDVKDKVHSLGASASIDKAHIFDQLHPYLQLHLQRK